MLTVSLVGSPRFSSNRDSSSIIHLHIVLARFGRWIWACAVPQYDLSAEEAQALELHGLFTGPDWSQILRILKS
jgi:hypothetical protein